MNSYWSFMSLVIAAAPVIIFFVWYERKKKSSKEVALIATLAALAAMSRIAFAAIPDFKPTSFIVIVSGCVFGPAAGFAVGVLAAFSSNIFLGQGPWTLLQMICWGAMGATCGIYGKVAVRPSRGILMLIGFGWGFIFGWIMNIWYWISFVYPLNLQSFILTQASSFWFDLLHASGNVFFIYFMGKDIINILNRFKKRLTVEYY